MICELSALIINQFESNSTKFNQFESNGTKFRKSLCAEMGKLGLSNMWVYKTGP